MTRYILALAVGLSPVLFASNALACEGGCGMQGCGAHMAARQQPSPTDPQKVTVRVSGLKGAAAVGKIETALAGLEGVIDAQVTPADGARVTYIPAKVTVEAIRKAIDDAGFKTDSVM